MKFRQIVPYRSKRLVEECFIIAVAAVQRRFGKQKMLRAIKDCEPFEIPIPCNPPFRIHLTYTLHPLVNRPGKWSSIEDGTARLYFSCPRCGRAVFKLYYFLFPGSTHASELLCRCCHKLGYVSQNCSGNKFYLHVVKPFRQLRRIKECLSLRAISRAERMRLESIRKMLESYIRESMRKFGRKSPHLAVGYHEPVSLASRRKREYKSLTLA